MRERLSFPLPDRKATMPEISPATRFNVANWLWTYDVKITPTATMTAVREWVRKATYAESFPSSYTAEMVEASEALMRFFTDTAAPLVSSEFLDAARRVGALSARKGGLL